MATVFTFDSESELEFFLNNATLPADLGIISKGAKFTVGGLDGTIVSPEAQAVLDRITGAGGSLNTTEEAAIAAFVDREVTAARWPTVAGGASSGLIDEFMFLGFQDALASDVGWLLSVATNTDVTHVPGVGKTYNGITSFSDTKYTPGFSGVNYFQNDALFGAFLFSGAAGTSRTILGAFNTPFRVRMAIAANGSFSTGVNSTNNDGHSGTITAEVLQILSRTTAPNHLWHQNGNLQATITQTSNGIPTLSIYLGARNNQGVAELFLDGTLSSFIVGAAVGFDQLEHYNSFVQFLIDVNFFTQPVIDAFPNALGAGEETAIENFINSEVLNGNWFLYDAFACFGLTDEANSLLDWKRLSAMTNNGATKVADGFSFNDANPDTIDTNYNATTNGVNYLQDSALAGIFIKVPSTVNGYMFDAGAGVLARIQNRLTDVRGSMNDGGATIPSGDNAEPRNDEYMLFSRVASTSWQVIRDGVNAGTGTFASNGIPDNNFIIGTNGVSPINGILSSFIAGAAVGFNQSSHNTNMVTLLTALGVLP